MIAIRTFVKLIVVAGISLFAQLSFAQKAMDIQYVRPSVDFSAYTQINLHPLDLAKTKVVPPAWAEDQSPKKWNLAPESILTVQGLFKDTVQAAIEKDARFKVVPFTGPKILEVEVKITSLTPYAAKDEKVLTKGTGEISIQVEITDGATGDLLVLLAGDQQVGEEYQEASVDTNKANVTALFKVWGERFLAQLQAAQK